MFSRNAELITAPLITAYSARRGTALPTFLFVSFVYFEDSFFNFSVTFRFHETDQRDSRSLPGGGAARDFLRVLPAEDRGRRPESARFDHTEAARGEAGLLLGDVW